MSAESAAANARAEEDGRFLRWWKAVLQELRKPTEDGLHRQMVTVLPKPDDNILLIGFVMQNDQDRKWLAENASKIPTLVKDIGVLQELVNASKQISLMSPDEPASE